MTMTKTTRREVEGLQARAGWLLAREDGDSIEKISRDSGVSRKTVGKWLRRFDDFGIEGLLSKTPKGRPPVDSVIAKEVVRLARDTRPPADLGDQWSSRLLGEVFGLSGDWVKAAWQNQGFRPSEHLEQSLRNPFRPVPLGPDLTVPAWLKLHIGLRCGERGQTMEEYILFSLTQGEDPEEYREKIFAGLRGRWTEWNEGLPREDPRHPEYRQRIREEGDSDGN